MMNASVETTNKSQTPSLSAKAPAPSSWIWAVPAFKTTQNSSPSLAEGASGAVIRAPQSRWFGCLVIAILIAWLALIITLVVGAGAILALFAYASAGTSSYILCILTLGKKQATAASTS